MKTAQTQDFKKSSEGQFYKNAFTVLSQGGKLNW